MPCALLSTCSTPPGLLDKVLANGTLRVVTRNSATTYYLGAEGPTGPDYELARGFADSLGVQLDLLVVPTVDEVIPALLAGRADLAAAHLTVTAPREQTVRFGPAYQQIAQLVVYRAGSRRPRKVADLLDGRLGVIAGSSHLETLERLAPDYPDLAWRLIPSASVDALFAAVSSGELDYAIADSSAFRIHRRYHPEVRLGFELKKKDQIAWAFRRDADGSLYRHAVQFFARLRISGELDRLLARYYEHTRQFDYVGTRRFIRHIDSRLPRYRKYFEEAALETGLDWRLIAAIAYQESHWDPAAVSPTGVRGLMMLTQATARQLGVQDRTDPRESIVGGARYLIHVRDKIPERIPEPDRTWFALAAYNVGYGHLEDARVIAELTDRDPDRWADVRETLPLLSEQAWHTRVKRGYARGREPVIYVRNVRSYYDILVWLAPAELGDRLEAHAATATRAP